MAKNLFVEDILVPFEKTRTHHLIDENGRMKAYEFKHGARTELPHDTALKLVDIPEGFAVFTDAEGGSPMKPNPKNVELAAAAAPLQLKPNEMISTLEDLSDAALLRRAQGLPGGVDLDQEVPRDVLINFILAGGESEEQSV